MEKKDANSNSGTQNNTDSKNVYTKSDSRIYHIICANLDIKANNTSVTDKKISINISNKDVNLSDNLGKANESGLDVTNNGGMSKINIKVGVVLDEIYIKADKKFGAKLLQIVIII